MCSIHNVRTKMIKICKSCGKEFQNLSEGVLYSSSAIGVLEFCSDQCSKNYFNSVMKWKNCGRTLYNGVILNRLRCHSCFELGSAAGIQNIQPFRFTLEVSYLLLGSWNLLEWWRRSNKFGNLMPKKNLVFFSTVITSKPEIAWDTPIFWFYHFILLDAFHHISAVTWDQVFWHWICLRRRKIKA